MKIVYLVEAAEDTPRLEIAQYVPNTSDLLNFDGRPKAAIWPKPELQVRAERLPDSLYVFYRLAPGAIVYRDDVLTACEDFSNVIHQGSEPLPLIYDQIRFEITNIIDWVSPPPQVPGAPPCPVDKHYKTLLRVKGRPPHDLLCVSGVTHAMDEFKGIYDAYGFTGLRFTELWRGE